MRTTVYNRELLVIIDDDGSARAVPVGRVSAAPTPSRAYVTQCTYTYHYVQYASARRLDATVATAAGASDRIISYNNI